MCPFAAAAFVGEHSFSNTLAAGRPDVDDLATGRSNLPAQVAGQHCRSACGHSVRLWCRDERGRNGHTISRATAQAIRWIFVRLSQRQVKCVTIAVSAPKVCPDGIDKPGKCAGVHRASASSAALVSKNVPQSAKYYDDAGYLYHKTELEEGYRTPCGGQPVPLKPDDKRLTRLRQPLYMPIFCRSPYHIRYGHGRQSPAAAASPRMRLAEKVSHAVTMVSARRNGAELREQRFQAGRLAGCK